MTDDKTFYEIQRLRRIAQEREHMWLAATRGSAEANRAVARLSKTNKALRKYARRWVPVEKKLPAPTRLVLVAVTEEHIRSVVIAVLLSDGAWRDDSGHPLGGTPTHWQALPEWPE